MIRAPKEYLFGCLNLWVNLGRSRILIGGVDLRVPRSQSAAPYPRAVFLFSPTSFLSSLLCTSFRLSLWSGLIKIIKCNLYKLTKTKRINSISGLAGLLPATANPVSNCKPRPRRERDSEPQFLEASVADLHTRDSTAYTLAVVYPSFLPTTSLSSILVSGDRVSLPKCRSSQKRSSGSRAPTLDLEPDAF